MKLLLAPLCPLLVGACSVSERGGSGGPAGREVEQTAGARASDSKAFLRAATEAELLREKRLLSGAEFAEAMREPGTVVLDPRSAWVFERSHVEGAINLPYTDMAAESLAEAIPDRDTRVLIYCRNNILDGRPGEAEEEAEVEVIQDFAYPLEYHPPEIPKSFDAALTIPTFITLYQYGYRNVWELRDVVDPAASEISFVARLSEVESTPISRHRNVERP